VVGGLTDTHLPLFVLLDKDHAIARDFLAFDQLGELVKVFFGQLPQTNTLP